MPAFSSFSHGGLADGYLVPCMKMQRVHQAMTSSMQPATGINPFITNFGVISLLVVEGEEPADTAVVGPMDASNGRAKCTAYTPQQHL